MNDAFETDLVGTVLAGTYQIEAHLGEGGMGAVFAARHLRTGRPYAVKVLLPWIAMRKDAITRFRREAEAIGALGHANVVAIHDFDIADGLAFLVMDRLEGEDLATRLRREGRLSLQRAVEIARGVGAGLSAAHVRGLVHRDLKPANVFLAEQPGLAERPVLLDFGLAKSLSGDDGPTVTASGVVLGTPQYMSPEQACGAPIDARTDLYSLATVFFEMVAGRPPFEAPSVPALLTDIGTTPPPPLQRFRPDLPPELGSVVARALSKRPDDRYPTAAEFIAALERAMPRAGEGHPGSGVPATQEVHAPPTPMGNPAASWPRQLGPQVDPHAATQATPSPVEVVPVARGDAPAAPGAPSTASKGRRWLAAAALLLGLGFVMMLAGWFARGLDWDPDADPGPQSTTSTPDRAATEAETAVQAGLTHGSDSVGPPEAQAVPGAESEAPAVEPVEVDVDVEAQVAPRQRALAGARRRAPANPPAAPPAQTSSVQSPARRARSPSPPSPSPAHGPPGGPDPGVVASVAHMERGDYAGCIRETRRHPPTAAVLGTRMNCAVQSQDHEELRRTCAEIRQRHPAHPYNRTCASLMRAYGISSTP